MNFLIRFLCCIALAGLASCALMPKSNLKPHQLSQCQKMCVQHLESCQKHCTDTCSACSSSASQHAGFNYMKYVHEKQVQGGYINRNLNSYRDPLQCRKVSCSCPTDFITCNENCTGVIQKRLESLPYCP